MEKGSWPADADAVAPRKWGAWIEIGICDVVGQPGRRTPRGVRGLKSVSNPVQALPGFAPSPSVRIEITVDDHAIVQHLPVAPLAGAWIEISFQRSTELGDDVAPLAGCVD